MEALPRELLLYVTQEGKKPFSEWRDSLRDVKARARIRTRLDRVRTGNLGDYRSVGDGVFELRVDYGPGYRIYFGQSEQAIIILLCGGDKRTQNQDILRAKEYWADYRSRKDDTDASLSETNHSTNGELSDGVD